MENQPPIYIESGRYTFASTDSMESPSTNEMRFQAAESGQSIGGSPAAPAAHVSTRSQVPEYLRVIGMDPKKFWPKKYRFTREKSPGLYNPLNVSQRNFYESNGYLIVDGCSSRKLIESIVAEFETTSLVSEFLVDKLVAKNGKLLQYVKCFCDERLMLMTHRLVDSFQSNEQTKATPNSARQPQRQRLTRDWIYLPFRPIDKVVCAITALTPLENVILVVPGTHKVGQCTSISSTLDNITAAYETCQERSTPAGSLASKTISKELFECSPENLSSLVEKSGQGLKYVDLKVGQTLFYHPSLVHGFSEDLVNFGKRQLASIAYYAAADCEYVEMKREPAEPFEATTLPIGLAHFRDQDPCNYNSWMNRPRLLESSPRASL